MQKGYKGLGIWLGILALIYIIYSMTISSLFNSEKLVYSDLVSAIKKEQVVSMTINGNTVSAEFIDIDENSPAMPTQKPVDGEDKKIPTKTHKIKIPSIDALYQDVGDEMATLVEEGTLKQEVYESSISWTTVQILHLLFL